MNNFFKTLFKLNWANIGKGLVGVAAGILAIEASPIALPPLIVGIATGVVSIGSVLGIHAVHVSEPPSVPIDKR